MKLKIKLLLFAIPLLCFLASCDKRQGKAEELVKEYLKEHLSAFDSYKSHGFSSVVKLKDKMYPGAIAPVRAFGRWEIEHTYSYSNGKGAPITETKYFEIDSLFTSASCCYVKMSDSR